MLPDTPPPRMILPQMLIAPRLRPLLQLLLSPRAAQGWSGGPSNSTTALLLEARPVCADTEPAGLPAAPLPSRDPQERREGLWVRGRTAHLAGGLLLLAAHLPHPSLRITTFLNSLTFNYYLPCA